MVEALTRMPRYWDTSYRGDTALELPLHVVALGDSITDNGFTNLPTPNASAAQKYRNHGFTSWVRFLTYCRITMAIADDQGVGGNTLSQIFARLSAALALRPDVLILQGGTNDVAAMITNDASFATMTSFMEQCVQGALNAGVPKIILLPIFPRQVAAISTAKLQLLCRFNSWMASYYANRQFVKFINPNPYLIDYTNANGDPLANYTFDGLHPSAQGAYWIGKAIADYINQNLLPPLTIGGIPLFNHVADIYNAALNPGGNMMFNGTTNDGLLAGTGGTNTVIGNFTPSGNLPARWTSTRAAGGTSTSTCVASKENPRTDGPNSGERQILTYANTVAGGASETFQFKYNNLTIGGANSLQPGMTVYAQCGLEFSALVKALGIELTLSEFGGASGQLGTDMEKNTSSTAMPVPGVAIKGVLRTPPIKLQSDSTTLQLLLNTYGDTSAATFAAIVKLSDFSLRQVIAG